MPNWVCKISGLCGGSDPDWTVESIRPWAELCYALFGPDRAMLGSNWPVDRLFGNYVDVVDAYRLVFAELSDDEQHRLFHRNAQRVYRIPDELLAL
jgi:predicted TIM-barrel fold metal-dependent hydrolase